MITKGKCSICGDIFDFDCDGETCKPSEQMQRHIEEHAAKGEIAQ